MLIKLLFYYTHFILYVFKIYGPYHLWSGSIAYSLLAYFIIPQGGDVDFVCIVN